MASGTADTSPDATGASVTPIALLETAALMGFFLFAEGGYGSLYAAGRLWRRPALLRAARASCATAIAIAVVIAVTTPLELAWKVLILVSSAVYVVIPPATWRYLEHQHTTEELN